MTELAIDIKNLTKDFGNLRAVDNLTLQVPKGSICGFLGANGSGKTTTIRMLCGLLIPTSGGGSCLGYNVVTQSNLIKKKIGYASQKFSLYTDLTVYENLNFIAGIYKVENKKERIIEIMNDLELNQYRDTRAKNLSGGWKQVLTLASCLVHNPELLVLDEPTAGVDPKMRKDFWDYLHQLSKKNGITILVSTHFMDEVERCQQLVYINNGKLLYSGITAEIIPFSKVVSYTTSSNDHLSDMATMINANYPQVSTTFMGNNFRISSKDESSLKEIIKKFPNYNFFKTEPSFEEVFISLMQ